MKKIIVADDSSLARMFIIRCLTAAGYSGYTVTEAQDGLEVYALMMEAYYDLVITDLNMPEMDGVELMTSIVRNPKLSKTPVVVITSAGNEEQRATLLQLGVRAILAKPITPAGVAGAIGNLLDLEGNEYA